MLAVTARRVAAAGATSALCRGMASSAAWETLAVSQPAEFVTHVALNRPDKRNAMNKTMWREVREVFESLDSDPDTRAVVLSGNGKGFTGGLDLADHMDWFSQAAETQDASRAAFELMKTIKAYQASMSSLEACRKPVVAVVHGTCIGAGVDMICAADIRYASNDAVFCVKEAEIGLAADVGTLQRLPRIIGNESLARELAFTARNMSAGEAAKVGLLSAVHTSKEEALSAGLATAQRIAALSPVAVQGTKVALNYSREHGIAQGLEYQVAWNAAMLQTPDIPQAAAAHMGGGKADFAKL